MNKKKSVITGIFFLVATVLIVLMIPRGSRYLRSYNLGELWKGETLTAPFDFSISKSNAEVNDDVHHAQKNYIPVYGYDTEVYPKVWAALQEGLDLENQPSRLVSSVEKHVAFVYNKGVVAVVDHFMKDADGNRFVRIDNGGALETVSAQEVFSPATAQEYLYVQLASFEDLSGVDWRMYLTPNLNYNQTLNVNLLERELKNVARTKGIVYENEVIVSRNQLIDPDVYSKLNSLKAEYRNRMGVGNRFLSSAIGHSLIVIILMSITYLYLNYFRKNFLALNRNVFFVLLLYVVMVGLCSAVYRAGNLNIYLIPFAIVPIYIITFFDVRMSIFELTTVLLICSLIVPKPVEFMIINFVGGMIAVFVQGRAYRRARMFMATGVIFACNCICYMAMALIQDGSLHEFNGWMMIWFGINAILFLGMYQLVYLFEKLFGFVSDITLFELGDTNQKLLLELSRMAPGTFQHTLQVANLSEAAAQEIGARALLARTGALYHDIGKMGNPAYFIENRGSNNNPHDSLTPEESAGIIRRHVTDGVALAKKEGIPSIIIDFITGHHGDSMIYYFYAKQKELDGAAPDPALFSYEGAKPVMKEVSIVMMADAVEAASRSLPEYTEESIGALVDKIIDTQMHEGGLSNSKLSFYDISIIKGVFKDYLGNIYHTRIRYPEREKPAEAVS